MDEESLFRDIHSHLMQQARLGEKMDTEMKLAERFNVTRYRVRRVLDMLARMGIIRRAQKRGLTVLAPEPEKLSQNIGSQITVSGFNAMEDLEARSLIERSVLELSLRRLTPRMSGRLAETVAQLERVSLSGLAVAEFHQTFRAELIRGCGNRVLQVFAEALLTECMRHLREAADELPADFLSDLITADRELLTALQRGDLPAALETLDGIIQHEVAGAAKSRAREERLGAGRMEGAAAASPAL